jgi:primosomal protein N' (replication factor Y)
MEARVQKRLFQEEGPPQSQAELLGGYLADVALRAAGDAAYTYVVPERFVTVIRPGQRVVVPFGRGNRRALGYVLSLRTGPVRLDCKEILEVIDETPLLDERMLSLAAWIARHYCCSLGRVLDGMVPAPVRRRTGYRSVRWVRLRNGAMDGSKTGPGSEAERRVLDLLQRRPSGLPETEVVQEAACRRSVLNQLEKRGLIERFVPQTPASVQGRPRTLAPQPTPEQAEAIDRIAELLDQGCYRVVLLYGVTGSGKTEVYLRAIEEVLARGKQAVVLVPEISLTPQTRARFEERLGPVAVWHSHLTPAQRYAQWCRIRTGAVPVVIGARSAVFAPCPQLGLIIVDEEHEATFKQETAPRYHARTVALKRAELEGIPVILGSATPSLESWAAARRGQYLLLKLPTRIGGKPLPQVRVIDLRHEKVPRPGTSLLTQPLVQAMRRVLRRQGQVFLLLNRRGFATHVHCKQCGCVLRCERCDLALVYHRALGTLLCHACNAQQAPPDRCPSCDSPSLHYRGVGTERLEDEVQHYFPGVPWARMDADSVRQRGAHERILQQVQEGTIKILLGTQMIAKGLDFPNVHLVGVVNADVALHVPDFRSAERTFQLVAQVAGRTGRGARPGDVLVQTYQPSHPAIVSATHHDYEVFASQELQQRFRYGYPPFRSLARVVVAAVRKAEAKLWAEAIGEQLRRLIAGRDQFRLLGPAPAPVARLHGKQRFHLLLFGPPQEELADLVREATGGLSLPRSTTILVDVDPMALL